MKVIKTIIMLFKDYRPLRFFAGIAAVLFVLGISFFIPILIDFIRTGLVEKIPSLIVICFVILTAIICLFSGIILTTLVQQHKQDFEFHLHQVSNEYKKLFPEESDETYHS